MPTTEPDPASAIPAPPAAYAPQVGDCFDVTKAQTDLRKSLVPCEQLHDDEVYAEFALSGEAYAGDDAVFDAARAGCIDRFAAFVGIPFAQSRLDVTTYHPSEQSWAEGDRRVVCAVWDPSTAVEGTLAGSGL